MMKTVLAFVGLSVALGFGAAAAEQTPPPYLALGDSIPFGYDPLTMNVIMNYPEFVAGTLGLTLTNASCPGETSASFINVSAPDNGCHEYRDKGGQLFVMYSPSNESQLQFAESFLKTNTSTRLVTITIGGDDLLLLEDACTAKSTNPTAIESCITSGLGKTLADFALNLTRIYAALRFTAHYEGPIVAVNYFSPDYNNTLETQAIGELDAITWGLTVAFGGKVADAFTAFEKASAGADGLPCAAGLAFTLPPATKTTPAVCDVHPTSAGQAVMAGLVEDALK